MDPCEKALIVSQSIIQFKLQLTCFIIEKIVAVANKCMPFIYVVALHFSVAVIGRLYSHTCHPILFFHLYFHQIFRRHRQHYKF